ncbi:MAG: hypothetical protein HKN44_04925 [Ilumatobacter sp.]|nr:hypothetical protein [Ilumatobacter sp.]
MRQRWTIGRGLLVAALFVGSACASDSEPSGATGTVIDDRDDASEAFIETEGSETQGTTPAAGSEPESESAESPDTEFPVSITQIDFDAGTFTISNHGDDVVQLGDIWACNFPDCQNLLPGTVAGGQSEMLNNPIEVRAEDGELALYRSDQFSDPDAMLSYVEWGSSGHSRSSVAVAAGLWGNEAVGVGLILSTRGRFAIEARRWSVLKPLPGTTSTTAPDGSGTATTVRPGSATTQPPSGASTVPASGSTPSQPPPDDYSTPSPPATPAQPAPSQPPPDDYSTPSPPATPAPSAPTSPPPPDEY